MAPKIANMVRKGLFREENGELFWPPKTLLERPWGGTSIFHRFCLDLGIDFASSWHVLGRVVVMYTEYKITRDERI